MRRLKRALELLCVLMFFPMALLLAIDIAIAVSLTGLFAYLGGLFAAWLLFAYVVPLATGIMTAEEIVAGIRSQRRHYFEGEPLPEGKPGGLAGSQSRSKSSRFPKASHFLRTEPCGSPEAGRIRLGVRLARTS